MSCTHHNGISIKREETKYWGEMDRWLELAEREGGECWPMAGDIFLPLSAVGVNRTRDARIHKKYFDKGLSWMGVADAGEIGIEWNVNDWRVSGHIYSVFGFLVSRLADLMDMERSLKQTIKIQTREIRAFLDSRVEGPRGRSYQTMTPAGLKHGWCAAEFGELIVLGVLVAKSEWPSEPPWDCAECGLLRKCRGLRDPENYPD